MAKVARGIVVQSRRDRPQLRPFRNGRHVYLQRVDTGSFARLQSRSATAFEWTNVIGRATKWKTKSEAAWHGAAFGHELTTVFGG